MLYTAVQTRRVFPATLPFGKQERFALSYRTLYKALASLRSKANRCEERPKAKRANPNTEIHNPKQGLPPVCPIADCNLFINVL
jgi:hypothetical protein